jgi:hypothetical protein
MKGFSLFTARIIHQLVPPALQDQRKTGLRTGGESLHRRYGVNSP